MALSKPPSLDVSDDEKRRYTEADVHSKLFEADMTALGYPNRTSKQSDAEHFLEQRRLAMRRLKTGDSRQGHYDGLYLIGNAPVVLCEIKRYDAIDSAVKFNEAVAQLQAYATSEDFDVPPPFLVLYCGKPERNRFYRLRAVAEGSLANEQPYEELAEVWSWARVKDAHIRGHFAQEVVTGKRLREILLFHLDRLEDDLRTGVTDAAHIAAGDAPKLLTDFGKWLIANPEALRRMRELYERKAAEVAKPDTKQVAEEMVTQAALNYLNKVFFLNLCEDRNLPGFYRIMREFLPEAKAQTSTSMVAVFLGLLRRKIRDATPDWDESEERAYRDLRAELTPEIGESVIRQNNWSELIRVAFDLAQDHFPVVYREDAYDYFRPNADTLAELVYDLSTKSFEGLTNRHVGDVYQALLSSRRRGAEGKSGRQRQQAKLGAFYTPKGDVDYMVSKLELDRESRVLDPCMGSGHFLEGIVEELQRLYVAEGHSRDAAYRQVVSDQLWGADIDTFATSLAAIRLFLLDEHETRTAPNLFVHDMLLHSPERPSEELFPDAAAERAVSADPTVDELAKIDEVAFDAVVGNPPYGARKPAYKEPVYRRLYGQRPADMKGGSVGTGDRESYAMFFANGIERLREGGRMCLITNDSFRSLTSHAALRRHILDRCKIVEILLTDTKHFQGVSFQFAGMAITTLEKCSDARARADNVMRLVDYVRDPKDYASPPSEKVSALRQEDYEALPETPFFVGVPREVFEAARDSERVRDVARGRQGLITADDRRFLAGIDHSIASLDKVIERSELAKDITEEEEDSGIRSGHASWVPFAKGEGFGEFWREPGIAIDWSREAVDELKRRDAMPARSARKPRFQNRSYYFRPGITYSVVSSGRLSARLMPKGWIFSDKGSAIFAEDEETSELFLLGYLNSSLATYFMKKLVNTTATAHLGYVEKLPYRRPSPEVARRVEENVKAIVKRLQADPDAEIEAARSEIDDAIFDLFEIRSSREEILRFYRTVGKAQPEPEPELVEAQAAASE